MRCSWFTDHFFNKRREERAFYENGSLLLEKLIACCNAKPIPIRTFSLQQLLLATNNFSSEHLAYYRAYWYKGSLEGRIFVIKRLNGANFAINDLVIFAQMSGHSNVLKPIGVVSTLHLPFLCMNLPPMVSLQIEFLSPVLLNYNIKIGRASCRERVSPYV